MTRSDLPGEVFVAPIGTPPDTAGWTRLGTATSAEFVPLTSDDVCHAMGVDPGLLGVLGGGTITASFALAKAEFRRLRRILLGRCSGPPPLAAGALPASTLARKRGGRPRKRRP